MRIEPAMPWRRPMSPRLAFVAVTAALACLLTAAVNAEEAAAPLSLQNDSLRIVLTDSAGHFDLISLPSGKKVAGGAMASSATAAKKVQVNDKSFGQGEALVFSGPQADVARIAVFPKLAFALLRLTVNNATAETQVLNRVPVASLDVQWGVPGSQLRILGTGGLTDSHARAGSYEWMAAADPQSRNGIVAGFLTHDRATGAVFSSGEGDQLKLEARSEFGRLRLQKGERGETETLAVGFFDDARLGLEAYADAIATNYAITLPPEPVGYCTWYSDKHGGSSDEKSLAALAGFAARELKPFGFSFVQIDDGWQLGDSKGNGPRKNFTAFNPNGPYPSGMKAIAEKIKSLGLTPGIWFMPFAGTFKDPWFAEHQDWFAKRDDGQPFDTAWGGTCLDMTNPAAQAYLRSIVTRLAHDWGYSYFKMDGLWTGLAAKQSYVNSGYKEDEFGNAVLFNPAKTNIEAFRDGLKIVREAAGPHVFLLGCCTAQNMRSYGGSFGLLNAMRIGSDNNGSWNGWAGTSPLFGSRNYFLNGRVWYDDPDPNYERASLTVDEARTIASWSAISGQLNTNSDWIPGLPPERLDILKRTMPAHGKTARPVDLFENDPPRMWEVIDGAGDTRRQVIALYNFEGSEKAVEVPLSRFGLSEPGAYAAFDFWAGEFLVPLTQNLKTTLPPHGCQVLAIRPMMDRPFLLSTSRHVTQGMVDVTDEAWDPTAKVLSGKSMIVAQDPCELRIVAPEAEKWKATAVEAMNEDSSKGVVAQVSQSGAGVRATMKSDVTSIVLWKVKFSGGN